MDFCLASRAALKKVKQELAAKEDEQYVRSELKNTLEKTVKEEGKEVSKSRDLKLNVISCKTFGMRREGRKIMSVISVAGHQAVKNLKELLVNTLVHLDIYADYLREKYPKLDSKMHQS